MAAMYLIFRNDVIYRLINGLSFDEWASSVRRLCSNVTWVKLGGTTSNGQVDPRANMTCLQQRICRAVCVLHFRGIVP